MSEQITSLFESKAICNLGTYTHTAMLQSPYFMQLILNDTPPSGLTATFNYNGSPIATATVGTTGQQRLNLTATVACQPNDTLTCVLSSSTPLDGFPNALKGVLKINPGVS